VGADPRYPPSVPDRAVYRCMTKAVEGVSGPPRRSAAWVTARRGAFSIFPDRVEIGDWTIAHDDVREARAYAFPTLFGRGVVLELRTDEATFQFGFNPWARPLEHLPYPVEVERTTLGLSRSSIALRLAAAGVFALDAWQSVRAGDLGPRLALDVVLLGIVMVPLALGALSARRPERQP
jgi:hypothetical protein